VSGADIDLLGYVDSPEPEMATWSLLIVPTRKGAGTRVKISDGFSKRLPIVTTSLGVSGYDVKDGVELFIADTPADFVRACVRAVNEPALAQQMAERGWNRFVNEWSWNAIRPRIWAAAEDCLRRSDEGPATVPELASS
jgi:glycosyltransferase involved in cell wall biosynthesis